MSRGRGAVGKGERLIVDCELSIINGVVDSVGVGGRGVKVGIACAWLTGVFVGGSIVAVGVGMDVETAEMILGTGVDWQAGSMRIIATKIQCFDCIEMTGIAKLALRFQFLIINFW